MPGIFGIISPDKSREVRAGLDVMMEACKKDSRHVTGCLAEPELGVAVGWEVPRGSFCDCLPVWNATRDIALVFFGEDFPSENVKAGYRTRQPGTTFETAAYLLQGYETVGAGFFEEINGWFAGVVIDRRTNEVILFNDRFGLRRVYWHEDADGFYFASEARALLRLKPQLRRLEERSLGELVACGCALQDRSLFEGVSLLPRAVCWKFSPGRPARRDFYFRPETWEKQEMLDAGGYYEQLRDVFRDVTPRYLTARQKVAVSLTGGLDGRIVMAWAKRAPGTLPCYTFGGPFRECSDVTLARRVAQLCGQTHEVIPVGDEFFRVFATLARQSIVASNGTMDMTGAVELYVNRLAHAIAPVRVTGNYGSEIVRGGVAFRPRSFGAGLFDPGFDRVVRAGEATYTAERQVHPMTFIAFKQVPWHHHSRFSVEQAEITPRSPYLDNALVALMYRAPQAAIDDKEPSFRLIAEGHPALANVPTDRGLRRNPVPLITPVQHLWQEFTFRAEYAYDYGMPQSVARVDGLLSPLRLERLFLGRHKFCHFRVWYRDQLAGYVRDMLLDPRSLARPYLQRSRVEEIVGLHLGGRGNYTSEIHLLLALELLQRELIEQN